METFVLIGTGWGTKIFARNMQSIFTNVYNKINGQELIPMPISMSAFKGLLKTNSKGKEVLVGTYDVINHNTIIITELPLVVYTDKFVRAIEREFIENKNDNNNIVKSIKDHTKENQINIKIKFKKDIESIFGKFNKNDYKDSLDPIELKLKIYESTKPTLNMVAIDGSVKEYNSYIDIFNDWFDVRKEYYEKRVERQLIKYRCDLIRLENIYRFITTEDLEKMRDISKDEQKTHLTANKYIMIDVSKINNSTHIYNNKDVCGYIFDKNINPSVSYRYILELNMNKLSTNFKVKCERQIEDLRRKIKDLEEKKWKNFVGDTMWEDELKKLSELINAGVATNWSYKKVKK